MSDQPNNELFPRSSRARLLAVAVGCSVLVHTAVIGGWIWWERGHGGPAQSPSRPDEIRIKLETASDFSDDQSNAHSTVQASPSGDTPSIRRRGKPAIPNQFETVIEEWGEQAERTRVRSAVTISAGRVLSDPATGLAFSAYFKVVKTRLARTAEAVGAASGSGSSVSVRFVLTRQGQLESISVPSGTPEDVRVLVRSLLAKASPFPPFPSMIPHESIAFDVLFRFD